MDFQLNEQQLAIRDLVRGFARRSIAPVAREWEHSGRYPTEIVEEMKAMGLFGMLVPTDYGGIGMDAVSYSIVFEEIARAWAGVAGVLGTHTMATRLLAVHGTEGQRARWLPGMASGEIRSCLALTEPGAGSDLQGISTVARLEGDEYLVNGTKTWITNARHAGLLPLLVKTDPGASPPHRGMSILMVEAGSAGLSVGKDLPKLGHLGFERTAECPRRTCSAEWRAWD
jgi:alkylation response protein AidB-like acyl-CoA dehydrogenase